MILPQYQIQQYFEIPNKEKFRLVSLAIGDLKKSNFGKIHESAGIVI